MLTEQNFPSAFALFLAIASGVFFGGLGAGLAYTEITIYRAERAAEQAISDFAAQQAAQRQATQQREAQKQQQAARLQATQQQAARQALEQARAKEAAWRAYFTPSPACREDSARGDCADRHIRAKREFEEIWRNRNN